MAKFGEYPERDIICDRCGLVFKSRALVVKYCQEGDCKRARRRKTPVTIQRVSGNYSITYSGKGRPSWLEYFGMLAQLSSTRAACSRRQVGAVLASDDNRLLGEGFNGVRSGATHCGEGGCPRGGLTYEECSPGTDYNAVPCYGLHAEHQAILYAGVDKCRDSVLYVTCEPCTQCWVLIKAVGVAKVIGPEGEYTNELI